MFPTRPDTNRAVQPQKMARDLKFRKKRDRTIFVVKIEALISCAVTTQLICAFVFAYKKNRFFLDAAQLIVEVLELNRLVYEFENLATR